MTSKKAPPKFFFPYDEWREEVNMWLLLTSVAKNEQALLVRLSSLEDNASAKRAVSKLKATELHADDGITKLLAALDSAFQADKTDEEWANYQKFMNFHRNNKGFTEYILDLNICTIE